MGIAYRADRTLGCTVSVWDGIVTGADVREHLVRLAGDNDWPPGHLHLTDLTTITKASVPDPELLDLLYEGTNVAEELRVAVVVRAGPDFEPDLRYATATEAVAATTFADLPLACAFLAVQEDAIQATIIELRQELEAENAARS